MEIISHPTGGQGRNPGLGKLHLLMMSLSSHGQPTSTMREAFPCYLRPTAQRFPGPPPQMVPSGGVSTHTSWSLGQNHPLLHLGPILKVTSEVRLGETSIWHLAGPSGHVHTSDLGTPQEITPLEGTGSRFSVPSWSFSSLFEFLLA